MPRNEASDLLTASRGDKIGERTAPRDRLLLERVGSAATDLADGEDVRAGLLATPKSVPAKYFYDDRGSDLFEQICALPEYYPTRTEAAILLDCAAAIARRTGACELVELGSGSSIKTRLLLDAYRDCGHPLHYIPIDISGGMLETSARSLLRDYPTLEVLGLVGTYEAALERLAQPHLPTRMLCFLGSTLGNFAPNECAAFLQRVSLSLRPGEYFLLGIDLQKPKSILEAAYNDAQGITAAFNLNVLQHLNRRFGGNFNVANFQHWAFYNDTACQIEMHLRSIVPHRVWLEALDLTISLAAGETIRTEISRKFARDRIADDLAAFSLPVIQSWSDPQHWFGLLLCQRQ